MRTAASAQYRGVLGTILTMVRTEGPRSLYNGLVAGLQRQMSFASVRIGLYDSVKQFYTKGSEREYVARTQPMTDLCIAQWLLQASLGGSEVHFDSCYLNTGAVSKQDMSP